MLSLRNRPPPGDKSFVSEPLWAPVPSSSCLPLCVPRPPDSTATPVPVVEQPADRPHSMASPLPTPAAVPLPAAALLPSASPSSSRRLIACARTSRNAALRAAGGIITDCGCSFGLVLPPRQDSRPSFYPVFLTPREARIGETQIPFGGSRSHCAAAQPAAGRHQLNTPRAAAAA